MTSSYADRYQRLTRQRTYQRAIRARGVAAILEPYTMHGPRLPAQRRRYVASGLGVSGRPGRRSA